MDARVKPAHDESGTIDIEITSAAGRRPCPPAFRCRDRFFLHLIVLFQISFPALEHGAAGLQHVGVFKFLEV
jgi:hypothetical protein